MTNVQARLLSAAVAMLAGGVAAGTTYSSLGAGVFIVAGAAWIAEYFRSQRA